MRAHILLVEDNEGATVGVRFPTIDAARDWEDAHPEVVAVGCVPIFTRTEALRGSIR